MSNIYAARIARLRENLEPDAIVLLRAPEEKIRNRDVSYRYRNSSDLLFLTGVNQSQMALLVSAQKTYIFANTKSEEEIRWTGRSLNATEIAERIGADSDTTLFSYTDFWAQFTTLVKNHQILYHEFGENADFDKIVFEKLHALGMRSRKGDFAPNIIKHTRSLLHPMRLFKDAAEISTMKKAAHISSAAHNRLMAFTRTRNDRVAEFECKALIESEFLRCGAEFVAYPSIVAIGNNATVLHYEDAHTQGSAHDLMLVDAGCELDGYASDITRTFPLGGKFSQIQREVYQLVLQAQKSAIAMCKPGTVLDEIHEQTVRTLTQGLWEMGAFKSIPGNKEKEEPDMVKPASVEEVIEKEYYRHFYMHKTSHFLGLDVHDVGIYYENGESRKLQPGMVITIEPGLYFPAEYDFIAPELRGIGIRIEDDIHIESQGCENLTAEAIKEIADIENLQPASW